MFLDRFSDHAHLLRICERYMASLHTFNIFDANISHNALLDLEWEGVFEGAEEI